MMRMLVSSQATDARLIDSAWRDGNSPTAMEKASSGVVSCPHRVNAVRACRFKSGQGLKLPLM